MSDVSLTLIVLKTDQVEKLHDFYSTLGIRFDQEKHGNGPEHYAGQLGKTVMEIYPLKEGEDVDKTTRIDFSVPDLNHVLENLWKSEYCEKKEPKQTQWGYRVLVRDPDGRAVELYQNDVEK